MIRSVLIAPAAASDIREITSYISRFNTTAADLFEQELWHALELLRSNPQLGKAAPQKSAPAKFIRISERFRRYLLFYELPDAETLVVMRILHGARDRK